jgi:hypothetical protein
MKQLLIILFFITFCTGFIGKVSNAQAFIRIYNDHGKKMGKGRIELIADTVLVISNDEKQLQKFLVAEIAFIKTKRSIGTSVGLGFGAGVIGSIFLADQVIKSSENIDDEEWNIIGIGILSGIAAGTLAGAVSGIVTKREKFVINGDLERWRAIESRLLTLPQNDIIAK